jgi:hypothetical protein
MIQTGSILTLDIEKPAAGGRMLARHQGQVVLVWGAIPASASPRESIAPRRACVCVDSRCVVPITGSPDGCR